jgi:histidyl-tRNA synthetase
VLPDEAAVWQRFEDTARNVFERYGYRNLRVPLVEPTPLYVRSIGEHTDVVEREMYTFEDKLNGESLTLRPEATAGIVRAAIEHNLAYERPLRVWTGGAMFRHERPQKGRYRQFHQLDIEAIGFPGPDVDAEQIVMLARLWRALELSELRLMINSIGDAGEGLHDVIAAAPRLLDHVGDAAREHFDGLRALLDDAGIAYTVDARLVRGLDYYNRTVFEWVTDALGAQGTVAGGGRYDGLFEELGGKPTPACGFAIGVERMILLLDAHGKARATPPDAYVVHAGTKAAAVARHAAETLRDHGAAVVVNAGGGSFKSQMKRADASGARLAIIVGDDEVVSRTVAIKHLREGGDQVAVPLDDLVARFAALNTTRDEYGSL